MRTYSDLINLKSFNERLDYLRLKQHVGDITFGGLRGINQQFYKSTEWRHIRALVITRDLGFDLGVLDHLIYDVAYVHHMNPINPDVLIHQTHLALDPEYLITVSFNTHNAIHYGKNVIQDYVERRPGDTDLW